MSSPSLNSLTMQAQPVLSLANVANFLHPPPLASHCGFHSPSFLQTLRSRPITKCCSHCGVSSIRYLQGHILGCRLQDLTNLRRYLQGISALTKIIVFFYRELLSSLKDKSCLDNHRSTQGGGFDDSRVPQIWPVSGYLGIWSKYNGRLFVLLEISLFLEAHISSRLSLSLLHSSRTSHKICNQRA